MAAHSKKKTKKIINNISKVIGILLFISIIVLLYMVLNINILPTKYANIITCVVGVITLLLMLFIFIPKIKSGIKIFCDILSILIISISIFGILKINDTTSFFKKITGGNYEVSNYYVLVLNSSNYDEITDIKDKTLGTYPVDQESYSKAMENVNEKVSVKEKEYTDLLSLSTDLISKKVDAIMISDAHKAMIEEEIDTFADKVKILYTAEVKTELDDITNETNVTKEAFTIYISGIDTYGQIATKSRSDVNMLITINPVTNQVLLTSIPRDYYVQLHGTTGLKDKLTHAGVYGINMSIQTIEDLIGIDINYYARVNFNTLIDVVDVIGGITIDSDTAFTPWTDPSCKIVKGVQKLDGKCALAYSRERHAYASGDRHRGQNQQQVITEIINKLTSSKTIISKYSSILNTLDGSFQTSLTTDDIYSLIKYQLDKMPSWDVNSISLDGTGSMSLTYSYPSQKLYVMVPTQSTVTNAKTKITGIINGQNFSEIK